MNVELRNENPVLIETVVIATGATSGYVYIRSEYPHAIAAMNAAIVVARRGGLLGVKIAGSSHAFDLEVRAGAGAYVCGEETSLLADNLGLTAAVRSIPIVDPDVTHMIGLVVPQRELMTPLIVALVAEARKAAQKLGRSATEQNS